MRTIIREATSKVKDENAIRLNGFGVHGLPSRIVKMSLIGQANVCEIDGWIDQIRKAWKGGPDNTLELACVLHRARRSMEYGQWSHLWRSQRVPFSKRKAEMLVTIGEELGTANAKKSAHLPSGWNTLYFLARLGRELAWQLIAEGRIHPRLRLSAARELLAEFKPELMKKSSAASLLHRRLGSFSKFVQKQEMNWTHEERRAFRTEISRLLKLVPMKSLLPKNHETKADR